MYDQFLCMINAQNEQSGCVTRPLSVIAFLKFCGGEKCCDMTCLDDYLSPSNHILY